MSDSSEVSKKRIEWDDIQTPPKKFPPLNQEEIQLDALGKVIRDSAMEMCPDRFS